MKNNKVSVSVEELTEHNVTATIGDMDVLDTGAQIITILPEEVLCVKIRQKVRVKVYAGMSELKDLASVKVMIGRRVWDETVALVSGSQLGDKGLLAINFNWDLLDWVRTQEFKVVLTVETRAQCKL